MKEIELISAADAGSDVTSIGLNVGDLTHASIQISFSSGTLNGTLTLEASNDNTTYATISGSSQAVTSGAQHLYNITDAGFKYVRVFWDRTSGTGTITAKAVLKEPINRF